MVERVEEKLLLPAERGLEDAVVPKTAKMREQMVRLHLVLSLRIAMCEGSTPRRSIRCKDTSSNRLAAVQALH